MSITPEVYHDLQDLILRFWACVDEVAQIDGSELFTPGGALVIESFRAEGAEELARYFTGRRKLSAERQRRTRHLCTNLRVLSARDVLRLTATITVFSGCGTRPVDLGPPSSLADFFFDCVETAAGWRFSRIEGALIFAGADTPDLNRAAADAKGAAA